MYFLPYLIFARLHRFAIDARRDKRAWHYLLWQLVAGASLGIAIGCVVFVAWITILIKLWWIGVPFAAALATPLLQAPLVRHVLVPLGWARAANRVGRLDSGKDSEAYGLCCAAWAYARSPDPSAEVRITEARDKRGTLGDGEIVATAFLLAGKGDADAARGLLRSLEHMVEVHPSVRELAGEWLAVDCVERRAWKELDARAVLKVFPATPLAFFLEGVAARRVGAEGAPGRRELWLRWLVAPYRRATLALMDDDPVAEAAVDVTEPKADTTAAPLPRAMATHLAFVEAPVATRDRFAATVAAWDAALDDGQLHTWIARRALELEVPAGAIDRVLAEASASITAELGRIADDAKLGAPPALGRVGRPLAHKLRHGRLDALESGFSRWLGRYPHEPRKPIDEWREYVALRDAYLAAVEAGGLELRRLAFQPAYKAGTQMSAWLWNSFKEYAMSHAISLWLLDEAIAVGDSQAIDICTQNTRLSVPTRLGRIEPTPS